MIEEFRDRKGKIVIKPEGKAVINRISAYGIAKQENKILFVRPTWKMEFDLPGGRVEVDEKIDEGLKRELLEETGFSIKILNKTPIKTETALFYADDLDIYFDSKMLFFLVEIVGEGNSQLINSNEIRAVSWLNLDTLETEPINKLHLSVIVEVKNSLQGLK